MMRCKGCNRILSYIEETKLKPDYTREDLCDECRIGVVPTKHGESILDPERMFYDNYTDTEDDICY
jgi:hypothetical protein